MKKKQVFKQRKEEFINEILPKINLVDGYTYTTYNHFIKFHYQNNKTKEVFDYFPGSERLHDIKRSVWYDVSISKLLKKISILS